MRRLRVEADLDKLSAATTEQFLSLIESEERRRVRLSVCIPRAAHVSLLLLCLVGAQARSVAVLKEREAEFDKALDLCVALCWNRSAFGTFLTVWTNLVGWCRYKSQMHKEMQECLEYVEVRPILSHLEITILITKRAPPPHTDLEGTHERDLDC